jgi:hypothetical protein
LVRKRRQTIAAAAASKTEGIDNEESISGYRDLLSLYIEKGPTSLTIMLMPLQMVRLQQTVNSEIPFSTSSLQEETPQPMY